MEHIENILSELRVLENQSQIPISIQQKNNQLVVSYNFIDAKWFELFGKSGRKDVVKVIIKLDHKSNTAKYLIEEGEVNWSIGNKPKYSAKKFRGQKIGMSFSKAYGVKEDGNIGELYSKSLNYQQLIDNIGSVFTRNGWQWKKDSSDPSVRIAIFFAVIAIFGAILTICILGFSILLSL